MKFLINIKKIFLLGIISLTIACNNQEDKKNNKPPLFINRGVFTDGKNAYDFSMIEKKGDILIVPGYDLHEGGYDLTFKYIQSSNKYKLIEKDGNETNNLDYKFNRDSTEISFNSESIPNLISLAKYDDELVEYLNKNKIQKDLAGTYLLENDTIIFNKNENLVKGWDGFSKYKFGTEFDQFVNVIIFNNKMFYYEVKDGYLNIYDCSNEEPEEYIKGKLLYNFKKID